MIVRAVLPGAERCRRKFLRHFRGGFQGAKYLAWERDYKWDAHLAWEDALGKRTFEGLLADGAWREIAARAVRIESATNLLFSFEKMALRDAVRSEEGARAFATGLFDLLHGRAKPDARFEAFARVLASLPRKQTRVLTWPLQTVFPFIAQPAKHVFLKPLVTKRAAKEYGFLFDYRSTPSFGTYASLLEFASVLERDLADLEPRDRIDIQSFIWVLGSDEYAS